MIAVDTNILVYAHRRDSPWHALAAECLIGLAEDRTPWAIPWPCIPEFFSIVTHPKIFKPPSPPSKAAAAIEAWFESPSLRLIGEGEDYWRLLKNAIERSAIAGPMIHDARIAAICQAHNVRVLLSADRDFSRFEGLVVRNPLIRRQQ